MSQTNVENCNASYTTEIESEIVLPALKDWVGDHHLEFNTSTPVLEAFPNGVMRITPTSKGRILTEKQLYILYDACERREVGRYFWYAQNQKRTPAPGPLRSLTVMQPE